MHAHACAHTHRETEIEYIDIITICYVYYITYCILLHIVFYSNHMHITYFYICFSELLT